MTPAVTDGWNLLAELIALLGAALLFGVAARRLGQNAILGYVVAGIAVGPNGLGLIRSQDSIGFLAELGVALLLFGIGLEFSWKRIEALGRQALIAGFWQIVLTWVAGFTVAKLLGAANGTASVVGNILCLSSTAFVIRMLQDRAEMDSRHGRVAVGVLLLQDLALIPLLVLQSIAGEGATGAEALLRFGVQLGKGLAVMAVIYVALRVVLLRAFRGAGAYADREVPIILSVSVSLGCAWASHLAGLSPVLGAFLAGLLLADQPSAEQIRTNVVPLQSVFVTLFFASIGMVATLPDRELLLWLPAVSLAVILGKALCAGLAIRWSGAVLRPAILGGLTLAQIGEFSFVLAKDGLNHRLLPQDWFELLIASAVISLIVSPYVLSGGHWLMERWGERGLKRAAAGEHPDCDVIVVGYGPAGRQVVDGLERAGLSVCLIESNSALAPSREGLRVQLGDATSPEILRHAGLERCRALVSTVPDPGVTRTVIAIAKQIAPGVAVIARARYQRFADPLRRLGAETVVDEEVLVGKSLSEAVLARVSPAEGQDYAASRVANG